MSIYTLSQEQVSFIEEHFFEFSLDDEDSVPDKELFERLDHPAELYYLAHIYNWDFGVEVLQWIVDSPLCTEATANLIFWRSQPDYYRRYELAGDPNAEYHDGEVLNLLKSIAKKHETNDFNDLSIAFDPEPELEPLTQKNPKWDVPPPLFEKLSGLEIYVSE